METDNNIERKILQWLSTGEVGVSSKAIAFKMCNINYTEAFTHPHDPDDFKRCLKLIIETPEIRTRLNEMKSRSPYWSALIDHWNEVETSFMEEVAEWLVSYWSNKKATKTYKLMQDIYNKVEASLK